MILKWILYAILLMLISWLLPGISVSSFISALLIVLVIGLINIFIRPIVTFISLPINILTLGLFSLVINALMLLLAAKIAPGFEIDGFWNAFIGAFLLAVLSPIIDKLSNE